jgi:hypothetical protein
MEIPHLAIVATTVGVVLKKEMIMGYAIVPLQHVCGMTAIPALPGKDRVFLSVSSKGTVPVAMIVEIAKKYAMDTSSVVLVHWMVHVFIIVIILQTHQCLAVKVLH